MPNIENKLFHGINLSNYDHIDNLTDTKVLGLILKSRKILTRNDLVIENPNIASHRNFECRQKNNEICMALHPNNNKFEVFQNGL